MKGKHAEHAHISCVDKQGRTCSRQNTTMGFGGKRMEQLRVSSAGLALTAASKVTAPRDEQSSEDDDKDRGEASGERCPVYVDEAEAVVRLIEADIRRLVRLV